MQFETMAMANLSLMLSLSQRSVFYQSVPLRLSGDRGRAGSNAQRRTPAAAPESRPVQTPRQYAVTKKTGFQAPPFRAAFCYHCV
jgi:hypothetical protein